MRAAVISAEIADTASVNSGERFVSFLRVIFARAFSPVPSLLTSILIFSAVNGSVCLLSHDFLGENTK